MLNVEGRLAHDSESAKAFIRRFINEIIHSRNESGYVKHYDVDLYLPMMMDWILNVPAAKEMESKFTASETLEVLYMDASWELCQEGIFRPGPRATSQEIPANSLGKAYSLTPKGKQWIQEAPETPSERGAVKSAGQRV